MNDGLPHPAKGKGRADQRSTARPVVLLVEDDRLAADSMQRFLNGAGYDVHLALTGWEGVKAARELRPQAIICDINLPEISGWEVARTLREELPRGQSYLIALSGYAFEEDQLRCEESGFDRHLTKPVDLEDLCRLLDEELKLS
jgi:CheY-like chemotaxis protein